MLRFSGNVILAVVLAILVNIRYNNAEELEVNCSIAEMVDELTCGNDIE